MSDDRTCVGCKAPLARWQGESPSWFKRRTTCGSKDCISYARANSAKHAERRRKMAAIFRARSNQAPPPEVVKTTIGHENGVPVRRVERGVGYGD